MLLASDTTNSVNEKYIHYKLHYSEL